MIWLQDIEQFIPFIKPLFDGLRAARDFFRRVRRPEHAIGIPEKTLNLPPDVHTHALRWGLGKAGEKEAMQISGSLQGTNTSRYAVRAAGIKLLEPTRVAVLTQTITVGDPESGMHSTWHLIPAGHTGELSFMFFVTPVVGTPGRPLTATISCVIFNSNLWAPRSCHDAADPNR